MTCLLYLETILSDSPVQRRIQRASGRIFYLPLKLHQFSHFTTVIVRLAEKSEQGEYIKTEACVYCGTVVFVAEGGFHPELINVVYCILS